MREVTLATLADCTPQEVFDHVVRGLASQGFKQCTSRSDSLCAYRGDGGLRCAAGWCMTDTEYAQHANIEGKGWLELVDAREVPAAHADLVDVLQKAHDNCSTSSEMRDRLRDVAYRHGLSTAVLEAVK